MKGDGILLKMGNVPLTVSERAEVRVRRLERIEIGGIDERYDTLVASERSVGRDCYPRIPKGEAILKRLRKGDKFLQVISQGETVLVYGPLKREDLYFKKPRRV